MILVKIQQISPWKLFSAQVAQSFKTIIEVLVYPKSSLETFLLDTNLQGFLD